MYRAASWWQFMITLYFQFSKFNLHFSFTIHCKFMLLFPNGYLFSSFKHALQWLHGSISPFIFALKCKCFIFLKITADLSSLPWWFWFSSITFFLFQVIGECHSNKIDEKISQRYKMIGNVKDREVFIEFCLYMILYHPPSPRFNVLQSCIHGKS